MIWAWYNNSVPSFRLGGQVEEKLRTRQFKMQTLSPAQTRHLRLRAQGLNPIGTQELVSVAQLVRDICGFQAQDPFAAALALRARSSGLLATDVVRAQTGECSIVRTWCMRGTLHLLATEDLPWLLPLFGPTFVKKSKTRYTELGLDEETCTKAVDVIRTALIDQWPLTRAELAQSMAQKGIPSEGQAAYHLLRRAGLEGVICFGPDRQNEPTYIILEDTVPTRDRLVGNAAYAELARRYLEAYGPAGPEDLAAWSGLSMKVARAGFEMIADEILEIENSDPPSWITKSSAEWLDEPPGGGVLVGLLPSFDPYLLGYRSRDLTVPQPYAKLIHPGGGVFHPTLLVDGYAAGTWKTKRKREGLVVTVQPFKDLTADVTCALDKEINDLGRFLEVSAILNLVTPQEVYL